MSSESRQTPIGRPKRRWAEPEDDFAAQPKRQRVSRACDSCRSKKDKCDGLQPVCSTCASLDRPCAYKANPKKRGLPTGYIRSLELLWGLVFQKIRGSEDVMRALIKSINLPAHLASMGKEAEGSDILLSSFRNSTLLRDIERILLVLELPEEDRERTLQAYADGETPFDVEGFLASSEASEWQIPEGLEPRATPLPTVSPARNSIVSALPPSSFQPVTRDCGVQTTPTDDSQPVSLTDSLHSSTHQVAPTTSRFQLPSNAWPLLDIYFSYTQCWFPILEKHDILRTAFQYTEDDVYISPMTLGSGDHASLWATLALASLQDASNSATRGTEDQSVSQVTPSQLYITARDLIPNECGPYELGHVQALLILSLIRLGEQKWTVAWMLVGRAVRIAQSLGLDQPSCSLSSGSPKQGKQRGRAKHVVLGCFVLETLIAKQTSQSPSLRKDDLARVGFINEDGLEEWHPWEDQTGFRPTPSTQTAMQRGPLHSLSTFNRLVSLVSILNELSFYKQDPAISGAQLELLELHLQRWAAALPKSYRVDHQNRPMKLGSPHVFVLEMMYQSISCAVSLHIAVRKSDQNIPDSPHKDRAVETAKSLLQLVQVYVETYSFSATVPTFGMILNYCIPPISSLGRVSDLGAGVRNKLQSFSSRLGHLWNLSDRTTPDQSASQLTSGMILLPSTSQQLDRAAHEDPIFQHSMPTITTSRPFAPSVDGHAPNTSHPKSTPDAFLSTPWTRTTQNIDEGTSLLPTPTPSLTAAGGVSEVSAPAVQVDGGMRSGIRSSLPGPPTPQNAPTMHPGLVAPLSSGGQHHISYQDTGLGLNSFVDMGGFGPPRRQQQIAPDLDALFDELASLDGAEKADTSPEFMQNLGFVSDSGIPEIYSFSNQIEPLLLAQTHQLPGTGPPSNMGDPQSLNMSGPSKR